MELRRMITDLRMTVNKKDQIISKLAESEIMNNKLIWSLQMSLSHLTNTVTRLEETILDRKQYSEIDHVQQQHQHQLLLQQQQHPEILQKDLQQQS